MPDNASTLEQIYTEIAAAHDRLAEALGGVDAKAVLVAGYAMAAATFLATQHPEAALGVLAYISLSLSVVCAIFAYAVRNYQEVEPRAIFADYHDKDRSQLLRELGATRVKHYEYDKNLLNIKVGHWWRSLALLVAGVMLTISSILVHTDNHDAAKRAPRPAPADQHSTRRVGSASQAAKPSG